MKNLFLFVCLALLFGACSTLNSNTFIQPNDSFLLGNNAHGKFTVRLKNLSKNQVEVYRAPIDGGTHSREIVLPNQSIKMRVERNTAFVIDNKTKDTASVLLKVHGDLGLSMNYKN